MSKSEYSLPDQNIVLTEAILSASNQLGLTDSETANALGMSAIALDSLKNDSKLEPRSKEGEKALSLIQIAQRLYAFMGGDQTMMKRFMRSHNKGTGGIPAEQITSPQGLMNLVQYLNAISK
jgi:hypothetical protein